jgi:ssDNA-specific exonuclease RecJ|tara:strand:- start:13 stop:201 length:189 start_codon:yes stop_codon:yes gene_type:complete
MLSNVEVRSIVARVEDLTTAQFDLLMEDDKFKNMFHLLIKGNNADLKSISKRLADYANENIC